MFFFQAEDGIRDYKVTGVQTCALPILLRVPVAAAAGRGQGVAGAVPLPDVLPAARRRDGARDRAVLLQPGAGRRSEERRVGKECRWRRAPAEERSKERMHDEAPRGQRE